MAESQAQTDRPVFVDVFETHYLLGAIRRHAWVVVVCALVGAAIGAGWRMMSDPVYRAEAVLLVNIKQLRSNAEGSPLDVDLVLPARRLVGTVCESDKAMQKLAERLSGGVELTGDALTQRVAELKETLYFDQRGVEMAALRAISKDPEDAARIANAWASVCQQLIYEAYGTTDADLVEVEEQIEALRDDIRRVSEAMKKQNEVDQVLAADQVDRASHLLKELNVQYAQLKVQQENTLEVARIASEAAPPVSPINASIGLVGGLFGLAGFFLGLAISLFRFPRAA